MSIRTGVRRRLNARNAAPFYLFVDDAGTVVASGFVGDDDWRSFDAQMREVLAASAQPASVPLDIDTAISAEVPAETG
jgi:hypothetical protein